jgi:hypothetical protein
MVWLPATAPKRIVVPTTLPLSIAFETHAEFCTWMGPENLAPDCLRCISNVPVAPERAVLLQLPRQLPSTEFVLPVPDADGDVREFELEGFAEFESLQATKLSVRQRATAT